MREDTKHAGLPDWLLCGLVAAAVFACVPWSMADPDLWWHLRDAQWQLGHHAFLRQDVYSSTAAGDAWMNHEWLAELPFYAAFRCFGTSGVYGVTLLTLETIFLWLFAICRRATCAPGVACFATILGVLLSTVSFGPRTLLFGWVLLLGELEVLARCRRCPRLLWLLPPLFAVWVNTHGSWLIGLVVLALYAACGARSLRVGWIVAESHPAGVWRDLAGAASLSTATLFLNPYGWRLVAYPFDLAFRQKLNVAHIEEWAGVDFHSPRGYVLLLVLALLCGAQLIRPRRWQVFELSLASLGLYAGLVHSRFLFLTALLVAPVLARSLDACRLPWTRPRRNKRLLHVAAAVLAAGLVTGAVRTRTPGATENDPRFPHAALGFLETFHPRGRVFQEFLWGGYLEWHRPELRVFVDSRVDLFEYNGSFRDYLDIVALKNSEALLARYNVDTVIFERDAPLTALLRASGRWRVLYEDDLTVVLGTDR